MRTGIVENEPLESAKRKLRASVEEIIPDEEERAWVEPRLATCSVWRSGTWAIRATSTRRGACTSSAWRDS